MKRYALAIGFAVIAVVVLVVHAINGRNGEADKAVAGNSSPQANVQLITVGQSADDTYVEVTGTVHPQFDAPISARVMGRILSVNAVEGQRVRKGQSLVTLDSRDLDAGVAQANAGLHTAATGYDNARVAANMEEAMSGARLAQAQAGVAQAEAALKAAQAKLDLVQAGPRKQERTQASLAVVQAKASYDLAQQTLKRMDALVNQGAISRQQYDNAKSQYDVAKAQYDSAVLSQSISEEGSRAEDIRAAQEAVRQAQAAHQLAKAELTKAQAMQMQVAVRQQEVRGAQAQVYQQRATLRIAQVTRDYAAIVAPFDGVVAKRSTDPGAMAAPGVPLMQVQGGAMRLEAVVPESVLPHALHGAMATVSLDSMPGHPLTARVTEIAPQGDVASHTFIVKLNLPADCGAKSGMFGRVRLRIGRDQRLLVPLSAVSEREGLRYVYVVDENNTAKLRLVTVGDVNGDRIQVLSGINNGERVVATVHNDLKDGSAVRVN